MRDQGSGRTWAVWASAYVKDLCGHTVCEDMRLVGGLDVLEARKMHWQVAQNVYGPVRGAWIVDESRVSR